MARGHAARGRRHRQQQLVRAREGANAAPVDAASAHTCARSLRSVERVVRRDSRGNGALAPAQSPYVITTRLSAGSVTRSSVTMSATSVASNGTSRFFSAARRLCVVPSPPASRRSSPVRQGRTHLCPARRWALARTFSWLLTNTSSVGACRLSSKYRQISACAGTSHARGGPTGHVSAPCSASRAPPATKRRRVPAPKCTSQPPSPASVTVRGGIRRPSLPLCARPGFFSSTVCASSARWRRRAAGAHRSSRLPSTGRGGSAQTERRTGKTRR